LVVNVNKRCKYYFGKTPERLALNQIRTFP
jgi:hypothetical protein